jgi:hypothetical protein
MLDQPRRRRERSAGPIENPLSALILTKPKRGFHVAAWFACLAILLPLAGCGSAKKSKDAAVAQAEPAQEEAKEEGAAAEAPPPPAKKASKFKFIKAPEKAADSPPPAASTKDFMKWNTADLDAAIARKDLLFIPAVIAYSAGGAEDATRAAELDDLVHKVGRMKDDPTIPLPLPAGPHAAATQQAGAPTTEPSPAATPAAPTKPFRFRMGIGKQ